LERDFAGVRVSPEAHGDLAGVCGWDSRFPTAYADWVRLVAEGTRHAARDGRVIEELVLDVPDFVAWCQRVAVLPGYDALRAYLILLRGGSSVLPGRASDPSTPQPPDLDRHRARDDAAPTTLPAAPQRADWPLTRSPLRPGAPPRRASPNRHRAAVS
jgi:hypothetical protein